jgi:hypothetical protein
MIGHICITYSINLEKSQASQSAGLFTLIQIVQLDGSSDRANNLNLVSRDIPHDHASISISEREEGLEDEMRGARVGTAGSREGGG